MNTLDYILLAAAAVSICAAVSAFFLERRRERRTMEALNRMLDAAIDGSFTETAFDESLRSAVETKLAHYLSASEVSSHNLNAEKEKIKELISDISHQTKTPISNILLYAQLLGEQALPEESASCVRALNAQAEKLSFLIGALVKTSRLETGILILSPKPGGVGPMLQKAVSQAEPKARKKGVMLSLAETDSTAVFDPKWTAEAVYNLLDNAVKYTPAGGKISVRAAAYELFCRIDVTDTGIGVAEAEQAKIFTRFYRSPAVAETEGVGIGLFLTRQIVTGQGGYVKVSSVPGKGATFSVFLPRKA
ncbi:MAG TPA: HAMP domain-containing sensor histidine kinase [Oscillospiraceae bacterium]|nr:HAMP domain-containing sensor histidine kinase [Oscillospiraceae bacterium]